MARAGTAGQPARHIPAIPQKALSDLWWKNMVVYCLDVETFLDSNGDGVGDFPGLTSRVDYLAGLGFTCLWLLPFYPTPNRDDGYDITDYYAIDPRLGTLGDFVEFVRTAHARGLQVMADLVVNHTSDQHPWFQHARRDPDSPFRSFYVWSDRPLPRPEGVIFPGETDGNWSYDELAGQYYLHRFHSFQPDLNIANPDVRDEIHKITGFWLELGVSALRLDAAPFIIEETGMGHGTPRDPHMWLRELRGFVGRRRGDAALVGEANEPAETQRSFFGADDQGDELHALFNFILNNGLWLALAREDARPLEDALRELPDVPVSCSWLNFLRLHDELNVDRLGEEGREEVFRAFAPDETMRIYGRGLRRRVAPIFDGDRRRLELAYSLAFSLPGAPMLLYGDEIGMGDDLSAPGRLSVRTPMQWSDESNGGFSTAPAEALVRPLVRGRFGPADVNARAQRRDPASLLNFVERLVRLRKELPELAWGNWRVVETEPRAVFAHRCDWFGGSVLIAHNLRAEPAAFRLPLEGADAEARLAELFADEDSAALPAGLDRVELAARGYRWFRLVRPGERHRYP